MALNETHDPKRRSWVASANRADTDFPIQNLPFGVFSHDASDHLRIGVAIGDQVLDLAVAQELRLLPAAITAQVVRQSSLNALFSLDREVVTALRKCLSDLLDESGLDGRARQHADQLLHDLSLCRMHRPMASANYTDFYAGIHHARAAGAQLTPEDPLPLNYKWVPIAYHGRASSIQASDVPVYRPHGQIPPAEHGAPPGFGRCERLDFELEMGLYIAQGNTQGRPISIGAAGEHIAGMCLLNDWSARDLQRWEMFPLGPFLSKSFATTVSPWVVTTEALEPFRVAAMARPEGDPAPLPYLFNGWDQQSGGVDVGLSVWLSTERMRAQAVAAEKILTSNARHLYWTPAQMIAHHTINGCNLMPGDLLGTGTISGPGDDELGSLLELTVGGSRPIRLPSGETRTFLQDGDEVTLRGRCEKAGFVPIGFGACTGRIFAHEL
ncbi:fumarylacetoacetase [Undibacterium sp. TJN25]|uniref:fumarylacetoacetase n=1 Tax=Undibacterium sp. TJN25 TaxID=3413056 RepID=UPI003BF1EB1D